MAEVEDCFLVITFDRENLLKNCLQPVVLPFCKRNILLQEIDVGIELNLDEVWGLDALLNAAEMNALCPF